MTWCHISFEFPTYYFHCHTVIWDSSVFIIHYFKKCVIPVYFSGRRSDYCWFYSGTSESLRFFNFFQFLSDYFLQTSFPKTTRSHIICQFELKHRRKKSKPRSAELLLFGRGKGKLEGTECNWCCCSERQMTPTRHRSSAQLSPWLVSLCCPAPSRSEQRWSTSTLLWGCPFGSTTISNHMQKRWELYIINLFLHIQ